MSDSSMSVPAGRAAALGAVSGLRTFTAPAVLAARGRWGRGAISWIFPLTAVGEYFGDKHPAIPARSDPPLLLGRLASGAMAGAALRGPRGAGAGAAGAAATAYASERLRRRLGELTGLPDALFGLGEDAVAASVAIWATRPLAAQLDGDGDSDSDSGDSGELQPGSPAPGSPAASPAPGSPAASAPPEEPAPPPRPSPLMAVARGLAAAAVGTAAMTSVQTAYLKASGDEPSEVPAELGRRVIRGVLRRRLPRRHKGAVNQAVHGVYGTAWGVPLGLVAGSLTRRPTATVLGATFGVAVWSASLGALPVLKLAPPPWRQSPGALAVDLGMHLVYGGAAGAAYLALAEGT